MGKFELLFTIDVAKPSATASSETLLKYLRDNLLTHMPEPNRRLSWVALNNQKELCEILFPQINNIVCDYTPSVSVLKQSKFAPRDLTPPHITIANESYKKSYYKYDHMTLISSVKDILKWAFLREAKCMSVFIDEKIDQYLKALRK